MRSATSLGIAILLLGFPQDFLSFQVSVRSEDETPDRSSGDRRDICQNLCSSKRNELFGKETSFDQCLRECSLRKRAGESLSSSVKLKGELNSPMLRSRRSTNKFGEDCNIKNRSEAPGYVVRNEHIRVDFEGRKPNLTIEWNRMYNEDYNWTSYALLYHDLKTRQTTCIIVPKDQYKDHHKNTLEWIIRDGQGNWRYPEPVFLMIVTYPGYHPNRLDFEKFEPRPPEPPTAPPTRGSSDTKMIFAVSGLASGIVLLLVLVVVLRKRVNVCSNFSRGQRHVLENSRNTNTCYLDEDAENGNLLPVIRNNLELSGPEIFYACYYPENDDFQKLVASVVNFFRMNGYMVVMDVMSCSEMVNLGPTRWAEQQIKKASNILVFLSPGLLRLCGAEEDLTQYSSQERQRVWYELSLLRTIYSQSHSAARMVCITLPSKTAINSQDLPVWAELRYRWPEDKRKILNRLNDRPIIQPL